jgi:polysaccharide biosynthesis/export protein
MRRIYSSLCLCLALVLGGCLSQEGSAPPAVPAKADVLKPGDALRITVSGEEELSGAFAVNSDGTVRMELLGAVPAAGLSPPGLQDKLRQLLAAGYLKDPQVVVERMAQVVPPPPALRPSDQ